MKAGIVWQMEDQTKRKGIQSNNTVKLKNMNKIIKIIKIKNIKFKGGKTQKSKNSRK